ncbi:MAG: GNAT family N-acetyltransferase [Lachnospiraceae bacterium]|nr:GNAT family N-acetyltransferase [Lachnospiraceae bacterium]
MNAVIEQISAYCMEKPGAYESRPFGPDCICYRIMGKIFAQLSLSQKRFHVTLKCSPKMGQMYRELYPGVVVRGYHCPPVQQPYWNTINLNELSDPLVLNQMIDEAYEEVIGKLTKKERLSFKQISDFTYQDTDGENADFIKLCGCLDQMLDELVGGNAQREQYDQYNKRDAIHDVIIVYQNGEPIACGGFKLFDEDHAELKRIYVDKKVQNIGIGRELVRRLEAKAKIKGFTYAILETGKPLAAACHLYEKMGYKRIENYGPYKDMSESVCMQKKI